MSDGHGDRQAPMGAEHDWALGPGPDESHRTRLRRLITGYWVSQAIAVTASLGLADALQAGPQTADELAAATQTHPRSLRRLLRALASVGVFEEVGEGRFALAPLGELLASDTPGSLRPYALLFGDERQWRAWNNLGHSIKTGQTAYEHAFGLPFYRHLEHDPDAAALFDQAMAGSLTQASTAVAAACDFAGVDRVVDVGGGDGTLLVAILQAHAHLQGVLFERPAAAERAKSHINRAGLAGRCRVAVGDFFQAVPAHASAYILSRVLHVFDDQECAQILANCRRAMKDSGRVLIVERVLPDGNAPSFAKLGDLNMLVLTGGLERTAAEYRLLLEAAGFALSNIVNTDSEMSVIEARPVSATTDTPEEKAKRR